MSFLNQPLVYAVLVRSIKKRTRRVNVEANGDVTSNLSVGIYNVCVRERRGWGVGGSKLEFSRLTFCAATETKTSISTGLRRLDICYRWQSYTSNLQGLPGRRKRVHHLRNTLISHSDASGTSQAEV